MRGRALVLFVAAVGLTTACESSTEAKITYAATLTGAQAATSSTGTGTFNATLDPATNVMNYTLSFTGLGSSSILAHIHGPAAAGVSANILVDFNGGGRSITLGGTSASGSGTINMAPGTVIVVSADSLRKLFDLGLLYVNVHSTTFSGGEIRGQISRQ